MIFDRILFLEEDRSSGAVTFQGLRTVIRAAIAYGCASVELGERRIPPPPPEAIAHARKAAWHSVPVQILFERYFAGYSVFKSFLLRTNEAARSGLGTLRQIHISTDLVYEQLIQAVAEEHERELRERSRSTGAIKLGRVKDLLSGRQMDAPELDYPFDATHLGLVASGPNVAAAVRQVLKASMTRLLLVEVAPDRVWGWVGAHRERLLSPILNELKTSSIRASLGEPARGLSGWRRTHRQAKVASSLGRNLSSGCVSYADVAVLASIANDELLTASLQDLYLAPLARERDGGQLLRQTLRAYFEANRNGASAAAALGVNRQTVASRLRKVETALDRPLSSCATDLELALKVEALTGG